MKGFLDSATLETAVGIILIYFVLATLCSALVEWLSSLRGLREALLRSTLSELFGAQCTVDGRKFLDAFFAHPLIAPYAMHFRTSARIPARAFGAAVLDLAAPGREGDGAEALENLRNGIKSLPEGPVRRSLQALSVAAPDYAEAAKRVEDWFNDSMSHATMRYKGKMQWWLLAAAALITVASDADSLYMLRLLRSQLGEHVEKTALLGWGVQHWPANAADCGNRLFGWLLTIASVSLGAPFWFDLLEKLLNMHHAQED